jgi:hypothetical protein
MNRAARLSILAAYAAAAAWALAPVLRSRWPRQSRRRRQYTSASGTDCPPCRTGAGRERPRRSTDAEAKG